jgi:hypothetical protein
LGRTSAAGLWTVELKLTSADLGLCAAGCELRQPILGFGVLATSTDGNLSTWPVNFNAADPLTTWATAGIANAPGRQRRGCRPTR